MRSRLEARFAQLLDTAGLSWVYEPECFANQHGQYLPDFRTDAADERIYWEVKPPNRELWCPGEVGNQMAIIWDSEPDVALALAVPGWPFAEFVPRRLVRGRMTTEVQVHGIGWPA